LSKRLKPNFTATKTYEEYIEMFKSACEELGRTITNAEVMRHDFGLPSPSWLINNCKKDNVKTYNDFLESLGYKPIKGNNKHRKYNYEIAFEEFKKRGLNLLPQEYKSCAVKMKFTCPYHPNIIQEKTLNGLIFGGNGNGLGCDYCRIEYQLGSSSHLWKGGITSLSTYLRDHIVEWKKKSMINCNYKCIITGDKFDAIHHLYSYNKIIQEIFEEINLPINLETNKYTDNELELIKLKNIEIHNRYPFGVCLCKEVHTLYHKLYGDDNTPEQFEEFKTRYYDGEFNNGILKKKNIKKRNLSNVYRKYSVEQANEIREKYATGNYRIVDLAREYNSSCTPIGYLINFKRVYKDDKIESV
jgi:hypothetical protein